jgi:hypothetical protein
MGTQAIVEDKFNKTNEFAKEMYDSAKDAIRNLTNATSSLTQVIL